ncbi:hypothetical protein [Roseibacillus persicicus]|uniref:hypothetical protein n=1 Tax=Roseibacillus persicicus TaxID=454148 RepID=UPI00280F1BCC|nr:hypothetical protein [Roseibacillus persicicus]MDQ8190629.1 hypothetical protein [Roseibacillus persicicus]
MNQTPRRVYLPKNWELPAAILNRLGPEPGRQRLMDEDGHLLLILHQVPQASDDEVRTAALFWRQPDGTWKSTPQPGGLSALEEHLKAYREKIHHLDAMEEKAANPSDYFEVMQEVQPVLRATRHQLEVLQAARQARKDEAALIGLRDSAAVLERAIDLAAGDAKAGMDFSLAKSAQEQSQAAHRSNVEARRLNRLVAFFFPLATLVSFFSMENTGQVLGSPMSWGVVAAGVLFGCFVLVAVTRGKG